MTHIPSIDANRAINSKAATYNAVKIQVNDPKTCIPDGQNGFIEGNGTYNGVSIEVNRPTVESCKHHHKHNGIYDYPCAECPVTSDIAPIHPINIPELPILPVAYQTTNFINNRTLINAEVEVEQKDIEKDANKTQVPEAEIIISEEIIAVPAPNVTTTEEQKAETKDVSFQGISFKANETKQPIEIIPPVDIKPDVDIPIVISNLSDENYDIQAQQMEEIAKVSMEDPQKAVPYIVTEVFSELINIVKKDSTNLTPPSEKQIELRKQIIINEMIKESAIANKQDPNSIELPYKHSEKDIKEAVTLSSMEQAERNKEYALYTMAILAKVYTDEVQRHTGNVVPLTDLPGVSAIVDTLRFDSNTEVKISAIDALRYLYRPEYKDEITSVLNLAADDSNPYVSRNAAVALESFN